MDDRSVRDFHDLLVAEVEAWGGWWLVEREQDGHNGFPQLVFPEHPPVGGTSGVIMDTNCFSSKGFRCAMQNPVALIPLWVRSA